LNAVQMIEAAHRGEIDLFYQVGGNFLETLPDPDYVRSAVEQVPLRIHQDIVLTPQMMVEAGEAALLLPAETRYEQRGGGTETSTERRIIFSPEIAGRRIGEALPEWEILMRIAERARPELARLMHFETPQQIREEIARAVPAYDGIQNLSKTGDQVQWGGERLCEGRDAEGNIVPKVPTLDGRAKFSVIEIGEGVGEGRFILSTRRGKQFNSMVHRARDPLTGASRNDVLINETDASRLGLAEGDEVILKSSAGEMRCRCRIAQIAAGNAQVHWPEGNVLLERGICDPECGIPDYNTTVEIARVG
jgi:predicted molibdopterin-dependent oxidoreductase YjgC